MKEHNIPPLTFMLHPSCFLKNPIISKVYKAERGLYIQGIQLTFYSKQSMFSFMKTQNNLINEF